MRALAVCTAYINATISACLHGHAIVEVWRMPVQPAPRGFCCICCLMPPSHKGRFSRLLKTISLEIGHWPGITLCWGYRWKFRLQHNLWGPHTVSVPKNSLRQLDGMVLPTDSILHPLMHLYDLCNNPDSEVCCTQPTRQTPPWDSRPLSESLATQT